MVKILWRAWRNKWLSYRFRFVPWIAFNINNKTHRSVSEHGDKVIPDNSIVKTVHNLSLALHNHYNTTHSKSSKESLKVMENILGYSIERRRSSIPNAGVGVFVSNGKVKKGSIVALYPGTIYNVMEPILLPSLANPFIFRCIDGLHIDGKDRGLSKSIFKSCVNRDLRWPYFPADLSWLTEDLINPLNCGQYVNNETPELSCNVAYQECDLPLVYFPPELRTFLPNIYYGVSESNRRDFLRIVALIATKEINVDTEILSSYYTVVHK